MKIHQGNLHRSQTADALLEQLRWDKTADLLILSEQYRNREEPGWYTDTLGTAAIWNPDPARLSVAGHGAGRGFVWIKCDGITIVSCYLTPNESIHDFREKIDRLEDTIVHLGGAFVVAGDFNARAPEWGMPTTDGRRKYILEMTARLGLVVANIGNTTTFRRPRYGETIPHITLASEAAIPGLTDWTVIEDYTGSDHQYITFSLQKHQSQSPGPPAKSIGWNAAKLDEETLAKVIQRGKDATMDATGSPEDTVDATMHLIRQAYNKSMPRRKPTPRKTAVHWWNDEIAELRRTCLRLRRAATRARKRNGNEATEKSEE